MVNFLLPAVVVCSPLEQFSAAVLPRFCPKCAPDFNVTLIASDWTDGHSSHCCPRLFFGSVCNSLLVSRIYRCSNQHFVYGHHPDILRRLKEKSLQCLIPFRLWHISGFTQPLMDYNIIEQLIHAGTSLNQIENTMRTNRITCYYSRKEKYEQLITYTSQTQQPFSEVDNAPLKWWMDSPTRHSIAACYLLSFWEKEAAYNHVMREVSISQDSAWLSCDHTFRSVANIGLVRNCDKHWIRQYSGLFCTLNQAGEVMTWKLTRSLTFDRVKETLSLLNDRLTKQGKTVNEFYVDICCAWRKKLQDIFGPQLKVYLDIFLAVQRITKVIPKRHPFHKDCLQTLTFVFRDPSDKGNERTKPTPSPAVLRENLISFQKQWESVSCNGREILPPVAIHEIQCLLKHIDKGCLSGIMPGRGTNRNKRLHRDLNRILSNSKYGVELGYALLTSSFYNHNEKIRATIEQ